MVAHLKSHGFSIIGTELNPERIAEAKELFDLDLLRLKGTSLPLADASFDVVLSFDVFEHISESDGHLEEILRVLKPGGSYLFATPNKFLNAPFEMFRNKSLTAHKEYHPALHSMFGLRRRLNERGFEVQFFDVPIVNDFFRAKLKKYTGRVGPALLRVVNPDRFPLGLRTNFYVQARKGY